MTEALRRPPEPDVPRAGGGSGAAQRGPQRQSQQSQPRLTRLTKLSIPKGPKTILCAGSISTPYRAMQEQSIEKMVLVVHGTGST